MKKITQAFYILMSVSVLSACIKLDRLPETEIPDSGFWNTENDLISATNRLYQELDGDWVDNRADDAVNTSPNAVSTVQDRYPTQVATGTTGTTKFLQQTTFLKKEEKQK